MNSAFAFSNSAIIWSFAGNIFPKGLNDILASLLMFPEDIDCGLQLRVPRWRASPSFVSKSLTLCLRISLSCSAVWRFWISFVRPGILAPGPAIVINWISGEAVLWIGWCSEVLR